MGFLLLPLFLQNKLDINAYKEEEVALKPGRFHLSKFLAKT